MENIYKVIKRPITTERSMGFKDKYNKYVFEVAGEANKNDIKLAVEKIFKVKVRKVNTMGFLGKTRSFRMRPGKRPDWKKAVVSLQEGYTIELFEGV
jgi:large subunit ribosomal protein L23